jgi:flagellar capping protein FliD
MQGRAMMDPGNLAQIGSVLVALLALTISIINARSADLKKFLRDLDQDVDTLKLRMSSVEDHLKHLPDKEATHRLENTMARLEGELKVMAESLKPVARISDRLQEFLLNQVNK